MPSTNRRSGRSAAAADQSRKSLSGIMAKRACYIKCISYIVLFYRGGVPTNRHPILPTADVRGRVALSFCGWYPEKRKRVPPV